MQEVLGSSSPAAYPPSTQLHATDAAAHAAEGWRGDNQRDTPHAAERAATHEANAADSIEQAAEAAADASGAATAGAAGASASGLHGSSTPGAPPAPDGGATSSPLPSSPRRERPRAGASGLRTPMGMPANPNPNPEPN